MGKKRILRKASRKPTPLMAAARKATGRLARKARRAGVPVEQLAEQQLKPHHKILRKLIKKRGVTPSATENLAEDAARYELSKQEEVANRQEVQREKFIEQNMTEDEADTHIDSPEEIEEEIIMEDAEEFGEGYDNFVSDIFSVAKMVGKKALDLAKKVKAKNKGKKDPEAGTKAEDIAAVAANSALKDQGVNKDSMIDPKLQKHLNKSVLGQEIVKSVDANVKQIEKEKTTEKINELLPVIIISVIVIIALTFMFTKLSMQSK